MANAVKVEVAEGLQVQRASEKVTWAIDVTNYGSSPTSPAVTVYDLTQNVLDVTATVMPTGSPSVSTNTVTLPELLSLTERHQYRVELSVVIGGNTLIPYILIDALE